jgi:hypothetical protein
MGRKGLKMMSDNLTELTSKVYRLLTPSDGLEWEAAYPIEHFLNEEVVDLIDSAFSDLFYALMLEDFSVPDGDIKYYVKYYIRDYKEELTGLNINERIEKLSDDLFNFSDNWTQAKFKALEWMWGDLKKRISSYNKRYYLDRIK